MNIEEKPVLFSEQSFGSRAIGLVELNRPTALNALNLEMARSFSAQLDRWKNDPHIACILITGKGEKSFCAGGDVKTVCLELQKGNSQYAADFFHHEYLVDDTLHHFAKPVIAWADGLCLGGGLGLFSAAHYRIVTTRAQLAMPELAIGFFPDVGAIHFLNKVPQRIGWLLALTGHRVTAREAHALGLADTVLEPEHFRHFFSQLLRLPWTSEARENHRLIENFLGATQKPIDLDDLSQVAPLLREGDFSTFATGLEKLAQANTYFATAWQNFHSGSPLSARLIFSLLQKCEKTSRRKITLSDWDLAMNLCDSSDFHEGVRALLIDKDKQPRWRHANWSDVTEHEVNTLLAKRRDNRLRTKFRRFWLWC